MLRYNLHAICKSRGVAKPYTFMVKIGISRRSAWRILNNDSISVQLRHVEMLCVALNCQPNDLLVWMPNKGVVYRDDLSLKALQRNDITVNLMDALSTMPFEEFQELAKEVLERKKSGDK